MTRQSTLSAFGRAEGQLSVGGVAAGAARRAGGRDAVLRLRPLAARPRGSTLRGTLPAGIDLSYAVKANPMPAVVQHLSGLVDSMDVASALEMRTALDTPMPAERVSFAGPGKMPAELSQAVAAGVTIEMESETEAERVVAVGDRLGIRPRVAVRVNPDFEVKGSGMRMGGGPQQFGVDAERVPALLKELARADVDVLGFHIFAGSQNLRAEILCEAQRKTVDLALRLGRGPRRRPVRYLNIGGGFGIPYFDEDEAARPPAVGANLAGLLSTGPSGPSCREARVVIELGRFIVGECGIYVTRVIDRKQSRGQDLPRRGRRPAPSARRFGELRPGHPPQLPTRDRQPYR